MTLDDIKRALLASYDTDGGINHIDGTNLPSEEAVNRLAVDFMHLLFPGFFEQRPLVKEAVPALTEHRLADIGGQAAENLGKPGCLLRRHLVQRSDPFLSAWGSQVTTACPDSRGWSRRCLRT